MAIASRQTSADAEPVTRAIVLVLAYQIVQVVATVVNASLLAFAAADPGTAETAADAYRVLRVRHSADMDTVSIPTPADAFL